MISTHVAYKKLVSKGMSDELAEAVTEIMEERQDGLVTKSDLKLGIAELKSEFDLKATRLDTSLNWMKAIGIACLLLLIKLTFYK